MSRSLSGGGSTITDFVPLPNNEAVLVSYSEVSHVQLYLGTVRWTRLATDNPRMNLVRAARLTDGQLAVFGNITYNFHIKQLVMRLFDENDKIVSAPTFPGQVGYSQEPVSTKYRQPACSSIRPLANS